MLPAVGQGALGIETRAATKTTIGRPSANLITNYVALHCTCGTRPFFAALEGGWCPVDDRDSFFARGQGSGAEKRIQAGGLGAGTVGH